MICEMLLRLFHSCEFILGGDAGLAIISVMSQLRRLAEPVTGWLNAALSFFYPESCQLCGEARATSDESFLCPSCRDQVRFIQPPFCERCGLPFEGAITTTFECTNCREGELHFRSARSAVIARDPVLDVIHRYK